MRYAGWTFGNRVPGPALRVTQGDTIDFTLINRSTMPHSLDFHAAEIAPDKYYRNLMPGDSIRYRSWRGSPGLLCIIAGPPPSPCISPTVCTARSSSIPQRPELLRGNLCSPEIRQRVCDHLAWTGLVLDHERNRAGNGRISADGTALAAYAIPTDEERLIAREAARLLGTPVTPAPPAAR